LTYAGIVALQINHDALEEAVGQLHSRMHNGVIERHYKGLVPDYDDAKNTKEISESILKLILNNQPYTFD
jgi:hypothetical protein